MRVRRDTPAPLEGTKNHKILIFKAELNFRFSINTISPFLNKIPNKLYFFHERETGPPNPHIFTASDINTEYKENA